MKTKYGFLILAACGCLTLAGSDADGDQPQAGNPPVSALVATGLKSDKEADKLSSLEELSARGENAAEAVKPIEELLKDKSPKVRAHAALALGSIAAPKDSVPALAELLKDPDESVRRSALRAIRAIHPGPKVMIPICVKLLKDNDPAIRARVLSAIAEGGASAVPGLIEALKNDEAAFWALLVLREIGPTAKDAVPAIVEKLNDKRPEIRREAVLTLGAMGEAALPAVPHIAVLLTDEHARTAATFTLGELKQIPQDAEKTVRANAVSDDQLLSTASLWALARVHPEDKQLRQEVTEKLIARLKAKDAFVRVAAARALTALPPAPEITVPIWEKAMKNADETTIRYAMDALAALGPPAVPRLIAALKYEKFRPNIAYALGRMGPAAAPASAELAKYVDDKNSRAAEEAIIALGNIGPAAKDAVPALIKALSQDDDKDPNFASIIFALGKIGPGASAAESVLLKQLGSKDDNVRLLSAWALAETRPGSADVAAKAVPVLTAGLTLPLREDRILSAEALGDFGPSAATAAGALKRAASDADKDVSEAAAKALKAIESATAAPADSAAPTVATGMKPGDFVVTVEDNVEIGVKGKPGKIVAKGTKLKVLEIRGSWIGVRVDGKDAAGWVLAEQVRKP